MAREEDEGGSLDMLLDTLCNTFGGIILIALLLALSVNKKSVELYEKLVKTDDNQSELIREREQLKNSLLDLKDENIEVMEDLEDDAYSMREEIEELKDNLDDLNSDSSAMEKLAQLERQKLVDLEDTELTIEKERLSMEEELSRFTRFLLSSEVFETLSSFTFNVESVLSSLLFLSRLTLFLISSFSSLVFLSIIFSSFN